MDDKLLFVQYPHPGGEHGQDCPGWKCWNRGFHKRKFLKRPGRYVGSREVQEILFWGEWEAESSAQRIEHPIDHGPRFIHEPFYVLPKHYKGLQNSDPFVFGEEFLYGFCKQSHFSQLAHLRSGSVILLGSCKDGGFVLDMLFVVGNCPPIDHSSAKDLKGKIPPVYLDVTVLPWYGNVGKVKGCAQRQKCRLYFGATPDNPVNGMYSFFPCEPYGVNAKGFARPRISLSGRIRDNLKRGAKFRGKDRTERLGPAAMKMLWDEVVKQVEDNQLELGVYAEMPKKRLRSPCPRC
jgi:hypothetical protein